MDQTMLDSPSRRGFLQTSGVLAGSLVVGFWQRPGAAQAAAAAGGAYNANAFVAVGPDDKVIITVAKEEMGQGVYTSLPMLIADELEVDMSQVVLRNAPPDAKVYGIPFGDQFTGGSTSIRTLFMPMREAGAAARMVLVQAAAQGWNVAPDSCHAERGEVVHAASGRRIRYGKLVQAASQLPLPAKVVVKDASGFKLIGKPLKRTDTPGKVNGTAKFGIDALPPGVKFAAVAASPVYGGKLLSVDDSKARKLRGVRAIIKLDNAVAVVADNTWYAKRALAALEIRWDDGANANVSNDSVRSLMLAALARSGTVGRNNGDALKALAEGQGNGQGGSVVEVTFTNPYLAHATMEPMNCTVHVKGDSAEIWCGTQVPARARDAAARVLGLAPEKVVYHGFLLGGGFGRRLYTDYVEQAALIARQFKGPVKVTWSREEDIQHCVYRGIYAHSVKARLDDKGYPLALFHRVAGPANVAVWAPGFIGKDGLDFDAVDGSDHYPYDIPHMRVEHVREEGPMPVAFWRGVGPVRNLAALESFMDELATRAGQDPLAYRLALLSKDARAAAVLKRAGEMGGWGQPLPARSGRGIALMHAWDTYLAQVIELKVGDDGEVTVQKVSCAVDCGVVVNPDTVKAQMQGGIVFGLSAALFGEITVKNGRVEQSNFHDYRVLRLNEAPVIEVEIIPSTAAPGGIGEPGTAGVAAAFANAIYAATGKRIHTLPARPDELKKA